MNKKPKTRYPLNLERAYAKNIISSLEEMDKLILNEFDNRLAPVITRERMRTDGFREDSLFDVAKKVIMTIKQLSLGVFPKYVAKRAASKYVRSVSNFNKSNINSQLSVIAINPFKAEPWLADYMKAKVEENVSYITTIRDEYVAKTEQVILRGVSEGQSVKEMREELVKQSGMAQSKAAFVARDQTGSILGQMTAERHQRASIRAFRWSDSGDNRVRPDHAARHGKIYFYVDDPLLPGEDYNCRCVAEPVDDYELEELGLAV